MVRHKKVYVNFLMSKYVEGLLNDVQPHHANTWANSVVQNEGRNVRNFISVC